MQPKINILSRTIKIIVCEGMVKLIIYFGFLNITRLFVVFERNLWLIEDGFMNCVVLFQ